MPAIPFTTADLFDPNLKREFNSIAEMDEEHRNVRVWGGIHFRNSLDVGYDMGKKIAAHLVDNSLKPARWRRRGGSFSPPQPTRRKPGKVGMS